MNFTRKQLMDELDAMIAQAWGAESTSGIRQDPSLARTLESIKEDVIELYDFKDNVEENVEHGEFE